MSFDKAEETIQTERLGDVLYNRIAGLIETGGLAEDGRLPSESTLAERFHVSRPMVREVLSRLRESGVIVSRKGAGSFVQKERVRSDQGAVSFAPFSSLAQLKKGYDFRIGVEAEAAFWAAQNHTPDRLRAIRTALDQMQEAIDQRAVGVNPDYEFHLSIARASANEFFETVMLAMRAPMMFSINLSRNLSLTRPVERLRVVQGEHIAIYEAIESGRKEDAAIAMRRHLSNTRERVFEGTVGELGAAAPAEK